VASCHLPPLLFPFSSLFFLSLASFRNRPNKERKKERKKERNLAVSLENAVISPAVPATEPHAVEIEFGAF